MSRVVSHQAELLECSLPAAPESVPRLRHEVVRFAAVAGASERLRRKVALAVSEACTNAVVHGFCDGARGQVAVHAERHDGRLWIEVRDDGLGMRPRPDSPGLGLGTPLMAILADQVEVADNPAGHGTVVRLQFAL